MIRCDVPDQGRRWANRRRHVRTGSNAPGDGNPAAHSARQIGACDHCVTHFHQNSGLHSLALDFASSGLLRAAGRRRYRKQTANRKARFLKNKRCGAADEKPLRLSAQVRPKKNIVRVRLKQTGSKFHGEVLPEPLSQSDFRRAFST